MYSACTYKCDRICTFINMSGEFKINVSVIFQFKLLAKIIEMENW